MTTKIEAGARLHAASTSAAKQVKDYAKQVGLKADAKNGVPTIAKAFPGGSMYIELFDTWDEALAFISKAKRASEDSGKPLPWSKPNYD